MIYGVSRRTYKLARAEHIARLRSEGCSLREAGQRVGASITRACALSRWYLKLPQHIEDTWGHSKLVRVRRAPAPAPAREAPKDYNAIIRDRLRIACSLSNASIVNLAKAVGRSHTPFYGYLIGKQESLHAHILAQLADLLGVPIGFMYGEPPSPELQQRIDALVPSTDRRRQRWRWRRSRPPKPLPEDFSDVTAADIERAAAIVDDPQDSLSEQILRKAADAESIRKLKREMKRRPRRVRSMEVDPIERTHTGRILAAVLPIDEHCAHVLCPSPDDCLRARQCLDRMSEMSNADFGLRDSGVESC